MMMIIIIFLLPSPFSHSEGFEARFCVEMGRRSLVCVGALLYIGLHFSLGYMELYQLRPLRNRGHHSLRLPSKSWMGTIGSRILH